VCAKVTLVIVLTLEVLILLCAAWLPVVNGIVFGGNYVAISMPVLLKAEAASATTLNSEGSIDTPKAGQTVGGTVNVAGWYLDGSGVASIDILVDGILKGQASYGDARPDVKNAYPEYGSTNCGYHYALNVTHLPNGPHVIQVREIGMNDGQSTQQVNINLLNSWLSYDVSRSWALEISPSFILVSLCAFFFVIIAYLVDLISSISFFKR
jgi:hypothetical protein